MSVDAPAPTVPAPGRFCVAAAAGLLAAWVAFPVIMLASGAWVTMGTAAASGVAGAAAAIIAWGAARVGGQNQQETPPAATSLGG